MRCAAAAVLLCVAYVRAQDPPGALLSEPDTQALGVRLLQLMESTGLAIPGLARAGDPLRQNTQATTEALDKSPRDPGLTLQLANEIRAYLALADSFPLPDFFPAAASQQLVELRGDVQKLDRHFQALLVQEQADARAGQADPNNLKRYATANSQLPAPSATLPRYVFLGDLATDSWRLNEYFSGKDFVNRGIAGQTTGRMLGRFLADVVTLHPFAVIVLGGSGDIALGMTPSAVADNLEMMGDVAKAHSVQPVFASLLPVSGEAAGEAAKIQAVNTRLREYCSREKLVYVDYYSVLADDKGMMKADLSDDGVNPNGKGYRVMSPVLLDGLERLRAMMVQPAEPVKARRRFLSLPAR